MKKLSDYKNDAAVDLWADLLDPLSDILTDEKVRKVVQGGKSRIEIAKEILKGHKKEAVEIMLRIDDTPIDGLNIVLRLVDIITDIGNNEEIKGFFGFAGQEQTGSESSGSHTENTEAKEK
jgi:C-terminal processing protease CtpA/Prc